MALVIPADALPGPVPTGIAAIASGAGAVFDAARNRDWSAAPPGSTSSARPGPRSGAATCRHRSGEFLDRTLTALTTSVGAGDQAADGQGAVDALRYGLDLQLRYRPATEVDLARMDVGGHQLLLDATSDDPAGLVHGDVTALKYVRDRGAERRRQGRPDEDRSADPRLVGGGRGTRHPFVDRHDDGVA
jgi:hypothetical protein